MLIAVFDVGGTSVKYGIVNEEGTILLHEAFPAEAHSGGRTIVQKMISKVGELQEAWNLSGISISSAGQVDHTKGIIVHATDTIPEYTGLPVKNRMQEATGLDVQMENDVNCMALGEHWKGAARDVNNFLCVAIGTGIGGALFINGELYTGTGFAAGEIGHIHLYPNGKACTCGGSGCLERYASSAALQEIITEATGYPVELQTFFKRVRSGEQKYTAVYEQWLEDLTTGLKSMVHMLNPEVVIIGGGISAQGDFLQASIKHSLMQKVMPSHARHLDVKMAAYENKANLLGAAVHFMKT
ncbi:ROK family protein [Salibacterium sp. K-3]